MKYYATIYVDELFGEITRSIDIKNPSTYFDFDFTHAFLGLTKSKSPDELDKVDETLRLKYLKNKEWNRIDKKWYEAKKFGKFNDNQIMGVLL